MVFLCIDDDADDLEIIAEALKKIDENCLCHFARDGEEGLYLLSLQVQPDLIFLDINMPMMDGRQTLQAIRLNKDYNDMLVCILSTTITAKEKHSLIMMGANFCIEKAAGYEELCNSIRSVVCVAR